MNIETFVNDFMASQHGKEAIGALAAQGVSATDAQALLSHAAETAGNHVEGQGSGLLGAHPGKSFFAAFAAGLIKGDGLLGSLGDGAEGILAAKVTEVIASKAGFDASTASTVAAAATPYLSDFIKSRLG